MFNEAQKRRFIDDVSTSDSTERLLTWFFDKAAPHEEAAGKDICEMDTEDVSNVLHSIATRSVRGNYTRSSVLVRYRRWCNANGIKGAKSVDPLVENAETISGDNIETVRLTSVSSPMHLKIYLDRVFGDESNERYRTRSEIMKGFMWLGFCGLPKKLVGCVKCNDVDLKSMMIRTQGFELPIYSESFSVFKYLSKETMMLYENSNYKNVKDGKIIRNRADGDELLRGVRSTNKWDQLARFSLDSATDAVLRGSTKMRVSFDDAYMSGMFYRLFERELAGYEIDFRAFADDLAMRKVVSGMHNSTSKDIRRINRVALESEYQNWKIAHNLTGISI